MNRLSSTALTIATFCIGIAMIDTAITERANNSVGSLIFGIIIGIFLIFAGFVFFGSFCAPAWANKNKTLKEEVKELVQADQTGNADSDEDDFLLSGFRNTFRNFFLAKGIKPNSSIQNTSTQLYWHLLYLQKLRLDKHNVTIDFEAERKKYAGVSVTKQTYFDGKYEITEAKERISAKRTYSDGRTKYVKVDTEVANYNILNAKTVSDKRKIICPNCGNKATRENLLDGCDYCNTKFTVEDLGKRISNFALRRDFEVEYDKFKDKRRYYIKKTFFIITAIVYIFSFIAMLFSKEEGDDTGFVMLFVCSILGAGLAAGGIGYLGTCFFMFFIFPIIQMKQFVKYRALKKIRRHNKKNESMVLKIKQTDPLFSQEYFFSNVLNKLATIHYADKKEQISVFSEKDLSELLSRYSDIVDMDVTDICIRNVSVNDNITRIGLTTRQNLIHKNSTGFSESHEKLDLTLAKYTSCKTEAICEPSILRCKGCGASLSLIEGGKCQYCGGTVNLREHDWVIEEYNVL